ncbi:hypothetical protein [Paenibacillus polymyxa]|uniref:hypothetical protein n=1 Tax=Paenibacillus polymyxa TaxID=1406 RepID=UPI00201D958A|nr:hypothetical protein [Paenibacillus polymyxa]
MSSELDIHDFSDVDLPRSLLLKHNEDQNEMVLSVSFIQISTSMAERKNIGICIGKLASPDLVQVEASIYSLETMVRTD